MKSRQCVDVLQTPAFLCRQTNFIANVAAPATGEHKKGQFLSPWEMDNVVAKARATGNEADHGLRARLFVRLQQSDFRHARLAVMRRPAAPVVFDATHSVQLPGGKGTASGGQREFIPVLARAAVAAGVSGLFMETHENPIMRCRDGPNAWPLGQMRSLLSDSCRARSCGESATFAGGRIHWCITHGRANADDKLSKYRPAKLIRGATRPSKPMYAWRAARSAARPYRQARRPGAARPSNCATETHRAISAKAS